MISVALSHRDTKRDHENLGKIHRVPKKFRPIPTTWRESCISEDSVISPDKFATLENRNAEEEFDQTKFSNIVNNIKRSEILDDVSFDEEQAALLSKKLKRELLNICKAATQ